MENILAPLANIKNKRRQIKPVIDGKKNSARKNAIMAKPTVISNECIHLDISHDNEHDPTFIMSIIEQHRGV